MKLFVDNLELWFSAAGLVVIAGVPQLFSPFFPDLWQITAITAIAVGIIHGVLFWIVRSRQRTMRQRTLLQVNSMMKDLINNKLASAVLAHQLGETDSILKAATEISQMLENASEDHLDSWLKTYPHADTPSG